MLASCNFSLFIRLGGINFLRFHDVNLEINCQSLGELEIGIQILVYIREKQNRIKLNVSFWKFFLFIFWI